MTGLAETLAAVGASPIGAAACGTEIVASGRGPAACPPHAVSVAMAMAHAVACTHLTFALCAERAFKDDRVISLTPKKQEAQNRVCASWVIDPKLL